jgi:hypothetical protein
VGEVDADRPGFELHGVVLEAAVGMLGGGRGMRAEQALSSMKTRLRRGW